MDTSISDDSGHGLATPDVPHPSPAPDESQDKVTPLITPALLSPELTRQFQSSQIDDFDLDVERILSSIEDGNYKPRLGAPNRLSVEGRTGTVLFVLRGVEGLEITDLGESLESLSTPDLTAKSFSGGTPYPEYPPHNWDQASATSRQTFETALSSIGSYVTAPSDLWIVPHVGRWNSASNEERLTQMRASMFCEPLLSSIVILNGGLSLNEQDAIRKELLPLCDPSWSSSTSVKSSLTGLASRIEQICSRYPVHGMEQNGRIYGVPFGTKVFTEKAEELILEFIAAQPRLQHLFRHILSTQEPFGSQWLQLLKAHSLILDPKEALDWSGRGQHVEYSPEEQESIPLVSKGNLGFGASGIVDRVRCRRIDLARKTIRCNRKPTREEAAKEVRHLQRLQHRHIVRLVGTYMLKKNLSILMYPATEYSLDGFLDVVYDDLSSPKIFTASRYFWCTRLLQIIACLVNAVAFIHAQNTKHMDIKPNNILVEYSGGDNAVKVFITDFGIARSYRSTEDSFTNSPISYTRIYTAPEVAQQATRGPPADIFSLGCVFMEILATLLSTEGNCQQERLRQVRGSGTDNSYQANIENVFRWYESQKSAAAARYLRESLKRRSILGDNPDVDVKLEYLLPMMLSVSPERRPSAAELKKYTRIFACTSCDNGPEPFKAATRNSLDIELVRRHLLERQPRQTVCDGLSGHDIRTRAFQARAARLQHLKKDGQRTRDHKR